MLLLLHKGCSGRRRFFSGPTTSTATGCLCVPVCFFTCCACLALSLSLPDDAAASRSSPTALNNVVHKTGLRTARIELHAHLEFTVACPPVALSAHRTVAIAAASRRRRLHQQKQQQRYQRAAAAALFLLSSARGSNRKASTLTTAC